VNPTAGLEDVQKTKFSTLPELELRPLGRPDYATPAAYWYGVDAEYVCRSTLSSVVLIFCIDVPAHSPINGFHVKARNLFTLMHLIQCKN
jgi:hypothetical protein